MGLREEDALEESKVVAGNVGNDVIDSDSDEDEEAQGSSNLRKKRRGSQTSCASMIWYRICHILRVVYRTYTSPDVRSFVLFNLMMIISSFYIAMSMTNWNGISRLEDEENGKSSSSDSARFSLTNTWVLIVSQWSFVVLYFFTLEVFSGNSSSSSISEVSPTPIEMNNPMMIGDEDL